MRHAESNLPHHALLEEDVENRLRELGSPEAPRRYESRILKSGVFRKSPILIQGRSRLRHRSFCYPNPDMVASLLSRLMPELPAAGLRRIRRVLLVPEFIHNERFFLTHLYSSKEETLACYLYPRRLENSSHSQSRLHRSAQGRLFEAEPFANGSDGIFRQVLGGLHLLPDRPALHSWLYPVSELTTDERVGLREHHELYASA